MHVSRSVLLALLLVAAPVSLSAAQPAPARPAPAVAPQGDIAAEPDAMSERAAENFREGVKLFREKKFAQAEAAFEAAWALNKTHKTASNLGQAELHLNKPREAAEHFAFALRHAPANDPVRANNEARLTVVKAQIGTLVFKANVSGAEVLVNNQKVGDAPLADPVFVDPGKMKVRVRSEGYTSWEKELDVSAGQELTLDVSLEKPAPAPTVTASVTAPPPSERSKAPAMIAFGVGGAGLVMGIAGAVVAATKASELQSMCGAELRCPAALRGEGDAALAAADASTVGFVVAGIGAAVGVTLLLLSPKTATSPRAGLTVTPSFIGVKGAF